VQNNKARMINDKGLTLMEIVVAVALMAVIIIPVMTSFVTSMRVNQKSRKLMIASDLGQAIMEGFADKSYSDIKSQIDAIGTADLELAPISANGVPGFYNKKENGEHFTDHNMKTNVFNGWGTLFGDHTQYPSVSDNMFRLNSTSSCECVMLISENSAEYSWAQMMNVAFLNHAELASFTRASSLKDPACLIGGTRGDIGFLMYSDVQRGGYHYDVCIQFVPMMKTENVDATHKPLYYTYEVMLYIYEFDLGASGYYRSNFRQKPILTMMTGIRN